MPEDFEAILSSDSSLSVNMLLTTFFPLSNRFMVQRQHRESCLKAQSKSW